MPTKRNENIDSLKFCLMALVITGHVFSQSQFVNISGCNVVYRWIYMFHMPLFIFISGYFSRKKDCKHFITTCWNLIEPLILFQIIIRGYEFVSSGTISIRNLLTPWWVLWYLLSLLFWRIMLQVFPNKMLEKTKLILISTFAISLAAGFFPFNRFLSLQRTFAFMPFFFLGYCMRGKNLFLAPKYRVWSALFLVLTTMLPIFFSRYLGDLNQADPYGNPLNVCSRLLVFGLSVPMSIAFINLCPNTPLIAKQGKMTMQYYIYHALFIKFILIKFIAKYSLPTTFLSAMVYTLAITIGIALLIKIPLFSKLTNPSSLFMK